MEYDFVGFAGLAGTILAGILGATIFVIRAIDSKLSTADYLREHKELELRIRRVERAVDRLYGRRKPFDDIDTLNGPLGDK